MARDEVLDEQPLLVRVHEEAGGRRAVPGPQRPQELLHLPHDLPMRVQVEDIRSIGRKIRNKDRKRQEEKKGKKDWNRKKKEKLGQWETGEKRKNKDSGRQEKKGKVSTVGDRRKRKK